MAETAQKLRAGVVGAGVFGGYHAQKYQNTGNVSLSGVFDPDAARADELAQRVGARPFAALDDLLGECDMVTIASPACTHANMARRVLAAGVHVLVEKPIATTAEDAMAIADLVDSTGLVAQVGHQERFVFAAMGVLDIPATPRRIVGRRCNPFSPRGSDVSVTLDLMTHDLDLVRLLAGGAKLDRVEATAHRQKTDHNDHVSTQVSFANGVEASLTASRVHDSRDRGMRIEYDEGVVEVDFIAKTFTNTTCFDLNPDYAHAPEAQDSLGAGVNRFIAAVRDGAAPAVSARDGAEAVALAVAVDAAAKDTIPASAGA